MTEGSKPIITKNRNERDIFHNCTFAISKLKEGITQNTIYHDKYTTEILLHAFGKKYSSIWIYINNKLPNESLN